MIPAKPIRPLLLTLALALALGCWSAPGVADDAVSAPAPAPAPAPSSAEGWLERIEQRLAAIRTLRADIVFHRIQGVGVLDDRETREGPLFFQAGPPALFAVHFVRQIVDGRPDPLDMWYRFDGRWLVERNEQEKLFTRTEVVPPDAPADKIDPLATGEGPFFLPITARREPILKRFAVDLLTPTANDPPQTVHLQLRPLPGRRMEVTRIDLWYQLETLLPVRVETLDDAPNQSIVLVRHVVVDGAVDPAVVDTAVPREPGWRVTVKPYEPPP